VPAVEFGTIAGSVAALTSPNLCTRAMALEHLAKQPQEAAVALAAAFESARDPRLKARFAWAAGMLPGQASSWIARLATDQDEAFRIVALRMCRLTKGDVLGLVEKLVADSSGAVRRECAIALKGMAGERADRAWAALAARHKAGDRFELEALGIGADGLWDGRLDGWLVTTSGPKEPRREVAGAAMPAAGCLRRHHDRVAGTPAGARFPRPSPRGGRHSGAVEGRAVLRRG
jgi:hypothetical protein